MLFDTILATSRAADLPNAGSSLDAEFPNLSLSRVTARSPFLRSFGSARTMLAAFPTNPFSPQQRAAIVSMLTILRLENG